MFEWIATQLVNLKAANRDQKMRLAYPAYEAAIRAEHLLIAMRQYPTAALEEEMRKMLEQANEEVHTKCDHTIAELEHEIEKINSELRQTNAELGILQQPYQSKLDPLYDQLKVLVIAVRTEQDEKQRVHANISKANEQIKAWHDKAKRSPFLFGNGGKQLPKHALFGQSLGDLEGYKAGKLSAFAQFERCKARIAKLNDRQFEIHKEILVIKAARQQMYDLKKQGRTANNLQRILSSKHIDRHELSMRLSAAYTERKVLFDGARYRTGASEIERMIAALKQRREDFEKSFDLPEVSASRFAAYVENWHIQHTS